MRPSQAESVREKETRNVMSRSLASVLACTCLAAAPAGAFDTVYSYQRMGTSSAVAIGSCGADRLPACV